MTFTDKTIFIIRLRNPPISKDIDSRNTSDDDYVFHQPYRAHAEGIDTSTGHIVKEKAARLLQQAALQASIAAQT